MSWPLGELKALSTKAARGAGFSWALAEEAGYSTQNLEAYGLAGMVNLASYLEWVETNGLLKAPIDMVNATPVTSELKCPIALGCVITDKLMSTNTVAVRVRQPALLLPFVSLVAGGDVVACTINDATVKLDATGIEKAALDLSEFYADEAIVSWDKCETATIDTVTQSRASNNPAAVKTLQRFAAKTYAPATEASRLAGAGAGTTDND